MTDQHPCRPRVSPVTDEVPRPVWSVMIPCFNSAHYLRIALASVLEQDPGPELMQIEVIDDHSTEDDPEDVVKQIGCGRVGFYRQPRNLGHTRNFNSCLQRSRGRLVHLLHADDAVLDGFYARMQRAFDVEPSIGAAFCRHIFMDGAGHWQSISRLEQECPGILRDWPLRISAGQRLQTPAIVVRRSVYEELGGFDERISRWGEDWEMWVRIAERYAFWYEPEPLALYRKHTGSLTERNLDAGENIRDCARVVDVIESYLQDPVALRNVGRARETCALSGLRKARRTLTSGGLRRPLTQAWAALKCSPSRRVVAQIMCLLPLLCWKRLQRKVAR